MQVPPFLGYRMQCYGGTDSPILSIKELQKLLEFTSRNSLRPMYLIYNSRNYQSLLAIPMQRRIVDKSTIIEIIRAYQPFLHNYITSPPSTIVEIIKAYQPTAQRLFRYSPSTIVEIIRAYQPSIPSPIQHPESTIVEIIRAYQPSNYEFDLGFISTIVEIIRAYQPLLSKQAHYRNLQQQKLLELTSL